MELPANPMKTFNTCLAMLGLSLAGSVAAAADPADCAKLSQLKLPDTRIEGAEAISGTPPWPLPEGVFTRLSPGPRMTVAVPFCRVRLVIEKEIRVEVWLPQDWNQRFEGVGTAGLTGALNYPAMAAALKARFATASTDTGHVTDRDVFQSDWIEGHAQRVIDFGHRAHHLMALRAKDVVKAYYGRGSSHNYFSGCSSGGWQGLTEAQRYPMDYDGILAGAPAINYLGATTRGMLLAQAAAAHPEGNLDAAASKLLVDAAVARCDADDGLKDGLISAPLRCRFDPAQLQCKEGQTRECLTPAQVERAKLTYKELWKISNTELRLLSTLENEESLPMVEIVRRALVDQAWVSRSLRVLESKKMVERRADPHDSRCIRVSLTRKGRQILEESRPYAQWSEECLLQGVDAKKLKELMDQLEANTQNMLNALAPFQNKHSKDQTSPS